MTIEERQFIFSKDSLNIHDIEKLLGVSYGEAGKIIRDIRAKSDRLGIQGMVHVQDYIDYFNLDITRYLPGNVTVAKPTASAAEKPAEQPKEEVKPMHKAEVPLLRSAHYLRDW